MPRTPSAWQRQRVSLIDAEFRALDAAIRTERAPLVAGLEVISARLAGRPLDGGHVLRASAKQLTRLWYAWQKAGRKAAALSPNYSSSNHGKIMPQELVNEIQRQATGETGGRDKHQNGIEAAAIHKNLQRRWKAGEALPGIGTWKQWFAARFPNHPLPAVPPQFPWCERTVVRKTGPVALKRWGNIGRAAANKHLPSMERDYSKLRKCELYTLDDVRLDFVSIDELSGRVSEMLAYIFMEVASRTIVAFLVKPIDAITAADVDELIAHALQTDGFGVGDGYQTHIWFERGTVACSEAAQKVLEAFSDGAIKIHRTSMDGGVRWTGAAADKASGHSAGKAVIESFNRNLHRRLLEIKGQRGNNFGNQPANLGVGDPSLKNPADGERQTAKHAAEKLMQFKLTAMVAGADCKLQLPFLTATQAQQAVGSAVRDHNGARGHSMQGFHTITEAEVGPGVWREVQTD
jgi:hypothetical protein